MQLSLYFPPYVLEMILSFASTKGIFNLLESGDKWLVSQIYALTTRLSLIHLRNRHQYFPTNYLANFRALRQLDISLRRAESTKSFPKERIGALPDSLRSLNLEMTGSFSALFLSAELEQVDHTRLLASRVPHLNHLKINFARKTQPTSHSGALTRQFLDLIQDLPLMTLEVPDLYFDTDILNQMPHTLTSLYLVLSTTGPQSPKELTLPPNLVRLRLVLNCDWKLLNSLQIPHGVTDLDLFSSYAMDGIWTRLPPNLVTLRISQAPLLMPSSECNLPASLTYLLIRNYYSYCEPWTHLPKGLKSLFLALSDVLDTNPADWPPSLTSIGGTLKFKSSDWSKLPRSLTYAAMMPNIQPADEPFIPDLPPNFRRLTMVDPSESMIKALPSPSMLEKMDITKAIGFNFSSFLSGFNNLTQLHLSDVNDPTVLKYLPCSLNTLFLHMNVSKLQLLDLSAQRQLKSLTVESSDEYDPYASISTDSKVKAPSCLHKGAQESGSGTGLSQAQWVASCLPRSLIFLRLECGILETAALSHLPPQVQQLYFLVNRDSFEVSHLAMIPRSVNHLQILVAGTVSKPFVTTISEMSAYLPPRLKRLHWHPHTHHAPLFLLTEKFETGIMLLKPLAEKCPFLEHISLGICVDSDSKAIPHNISYLWRLVLEEEQEIGL